MSWSFGGSSNRGVSPTREPQQQQQQSDRGYQERYNERNPPSQRRDQDEYHPPRREDRYLSRFNEDDQPLNGKPVEWERKPSRQRRFTQTTFPSLHEGNSFIGATDILDPDRERNLTELKYQVTDASNYVTNFVLKKEEELLKQSELYDENGELRKLYDEDGNEIDPDYELGKGYEFEPNDGRNAKSKTITIDTTKFDIKEGWLWKKGSGDNAFTRQWTRRYFKFDMLSVVNIYYYSKEPPEIPPQYEGEKKESFKARRRAALQNELRGAKGMVRLMFAKLEVPSVKRPHKNQKINSEYEFEIRLPRSKPFVLAAETKEDFDKWIKTIGFLIHTLEVARGEVEKGGGPSKGRPLIFDEAKKEAALQIKAYGKGLFEAVAGVRAEFYVENMENAQGKLYAVMESRDLHYDLDVQNLGNGTYLFSYTPTRVGTYELSVMLDDYDILGSPFQPVVRPAPVSAPHCSVDGAGVFCAVVGAVNKFTIQTRNSFNQPIVAREVDFQIQVSSPLVLCHPDGSKTPTPIRPTENGKGGYLVCYLVEPTLEYIQRLNNGEHLEGEIIIELDDQIHVPSFPRNIRQSPFHPVIAASATGNALANAARHAALFMDHQQLNGMLSYFDDEDDTHRTVRLLPSSRQQQQQQQQQSFVEGETTGLDTSSSSYEEEEEETPSFAIPPPNKYNRPVSDKRRFDESTSFSSSSSTYLPVRRYRPEQQAENTKPKNLSQEERQELDAEREQLLRLRRDIQEGKNQVDEQLNRMSILGKKILEQKAYPPEIPMEEEEEKSAYYYPSTTQQQRQAPPTSYDIPAFDQSSNSSFQKRSFNVPTTSSYQPPSYQYSLPSTYNKRPPPSAPPTSSSSSRRPSSQQQPMGRDRQVEIFDPAVTSLFNKHVQPLKRVFRHYSVQDDQRYDLVRFSNFLKCCSDFGITPTFASKKEIKDAFELSSGGSDYLDFPSFVEALGHVAVNALGKKNFAHLYKTPVSRVQVLLGLWGLGDSATFESILNRERYF